METLTKRQKQTLDFITSYIEVHEVAPSFEEIRDYFDLSALSSVHEMVTVLVEKGFLKRHKRRERGLSLPKQRTDYLEIPLRGAIACGSPIEAIEDTTETVRVAREHTLRGKLFALRAQGDSMIDDGIWDGDIIIAKQQNTAENGDTVVALIDGNEATLKRFYRENGTIRLQPANSKFEPMYRNDVDIQGVVVKIIRNL